MQDMEAELNPQLVRKTVQALREQTPKIVERDVEVNALRLGLLAPISIGFLDNNGLWVTGMMAPPPMVTELMRSFFARMRGFGALYQDSENMASSFRNMYGTLNGIKPETIPLDRAWPTTTLMRVVVDLRNRVQDGSPALDAIALRILEDEQDVRWVSLRI